MIQGSARNTHKTEVTAAGPGGIFKLNGISHDERLENLCIILGDTNYIATAASSSAVDLPTLNDISAALTPDSTASDNTNGGFKVNDVCVVIWDIKGKAAWFIGYIKSQDGEHYIIEHLERTNDTDDSWRYPVVDDVQRAHGSQILPCVVDGEWDVLARSPTYLIRNAGEINNAVRKKFNL